MSEIIVSSTSMNSRFEHLVNIYTVPFSNEQLETDVVTQSQLVRVVDYTRQIRRICLHNDIMKRKFEQN